MKKNDKLGTQQSVRLLNRLLAKNALCVPVIQTNHEGRMVGGVMLTIDEYLSSILPEGVKEDA